MGEAARRKRERRKNYQKADELAVAAARGKLLKGYGKPLVQQVMAGLMAGMGAGLSSTPRLTGTRTGRFSSRAPNIANGPRSTSKSQAYAQAYGRQPGKSTDTWWLRDEAFCLSPGMRVPAVRYLYEIPARHVAVDMANGESWEAEEIVMPREDQIFLKEEPGYELACSECPMSLTCLRGKDHWPTVCKHCRTYAPNTVTTFDVVLHEKIKLKEVELKEDYRSEDVKVSMMCPLFHNSTRNCSRCQDIHQAIPKVLRIFAVGGFRPHPDARRGKPSVVKKKLAKKRLKKLYWEQLWKAPGVAHYGRRKNLSPSKLKAFRMLDKKQKDHLFDDVISHSARTHKERKQKNKKRRRRR